MPGARDESGRFYAGLILVVLALLVAVEVYGFRHANLFAQEIWEPIGLARLVQFGALYIAAATALLLNEAGRGPWPQSAPRIHSLPHRRFPVSTRDVRLATFWRNRLLHTPLPEFALHAVG